MLKGIVSDCIYIKKKKKKALCRDSARYYRVLGPYMDFHPLPCEEKKGKEASFVSHTFSLVRVLAALMRVHCVCTFLLF